MHHCWCKFHHFSINAIIVCMNSIIFSIKSHLWGNSQRPSLGPAPPINAPENLHIKSGYRCLTVWVGTANFDCNYRIFGTVFYWKSSHFNRNSQYARGFLVAGEEIDDDINPVADVDEQTKTRPELVTCLIWDPSLLVNVWDLLYHG